MEFKQKYKYFKKFLSRRLKKKPTPINPKINLKDKLLFIHVPKTGGTSIAKTLGFDYYTHIKACEIAASRNDFLLKKRYSFGVVRNPFDRFISLYHYAQMDISYYHDNLIEPENLSFPRHQDYKILKGASIKDCAELLKAKKLKHDIEWNQWFPQFTWLYDEAGKKCLVKKIYKLENLENLKDDLNCLGYDIYSFPKLNSSIREKNYKEIIDCKTRSILEDIYEKDLKLFNYEF